MLVEILQIMVPIVAVVAIGLLYGRRHKPDISAANHMNTAIFAPALIFSVLASTDSAIQNYLNITLAGGFVVLGSGLVLLPLVWLLKIDLRSFLPPMMFNNAGNLGLPLLVLAFGEQAMPLAVCLLIIEMLLHFTVGIVLLTGRFDLKQILTMPIIQATILGVAWSTMGWSLPEVVAIPLEMLGQISIPLMLFTLGVRLTEVDLSDWKLGVLGAIACPLSGIVCALPMLWLLPLSPLEQACLLLFASLPPAVLNFIVAEQYQVAPKRVASIVLIGNLGSLLVMPLMLFFVWIANGS
ncbi:AEC family transporter [Aliagarivorans taiwanensis]|uniref:AEC family transporter n=1 Tax=Aliagarivorans taiwanensis TaxID=561966 RepID=UPI00041912A7|nr:AEC family transporter [Aliagarivorans taiwanensis]